MSDPQAIQESAGARRWRLLDWGRLAKRLVSSRDDRNDTAEAINEGGASSKPSSPEDAPLSHVPISPSPDDAAARIAEALYLTEKADRLTEQTLRKGGKPSSSLDTLISNAQRAVDMLPSDFKGAISPLRRSILRAKLRNHLLRRHAASVFRMAEAGNWERTWDSECLQLLIRAHTLAKTPYAEIAPLFRRLGEVLGNNYATTATTDYLAAVGNWRRSLRRAFATTVLNAETKPNIRSLIGSIPKDELDGPAREALLSYAERIVTRRRRTLSVRPDAVFLALSVADTLGEKLRALDLFGQVHQQIKDDRNLRAAFNRFLVDLVYLIQTDGADRETTQPLEQEYWWNKYNSPYRGMKSLLDTAYWQDTVLAETARRNRFSAARTEIIKHVAFVSSTPKFAFDLIDMLKDRHVEVDTIQFDFIEDFYSKHRSIDLISLPLENFARVPLRRQFLAHPLVRRVQEADCIFVDFANRAAVWASWFKRPHQRLVVRLHAYEALSAWPYLINWAAVDGLVFVSPAIESIFRRELGDRVKPVPSVVIPNFKVLAPAPPLRKAQEPGRVLGMLGAVIYRKQPIQALRILKVLQERDSPDWRLRLAGDYWPAETVSPETEHKREFEQLISELPTPDSVSVDGFQTDIAKWYSKIDFLLSCSLREGTHEAVNEAMHFNKLPIVRNWPLVAEFGGARCVYPVLEDQALLYDTVDQAVENILGARSSFHDKARVLKSFVAEYLDNQKNLDALLDFMRTC